jgi:hypothetical protein
MQSTKRIAMKTIMKIDIDVESIALCIEALKIPHIAVLVGMLGVLAIFGVIFIAYIKASKG